MYAPLSLDELAKIKPWAIDYIHCLMWMELRIHILS